MNPINFRVQLDSSGRAHSQIPDLPKYGIYTIHHWGKVIRVGESSSGKERIWKGFRDPFRIVRKGKERKNYIAYHWRSEYSDKRIKIRYYPLYDSLFSDSHSRRALEAELTFQFRIAFGKWPKHMSEIHFLENYRTNRKLVTTAEMILQDYGLPYDFSI